MRTQIANLWQGIRSTSLVLFSGIALLIAAILLVVGGDARVNAQASSLPTFECTATGYITQNPGGGGATSAYEVNLLTGANSIVGPSFHPTPTNAYGYNTEDNYLYGVQEGASRGHILRVGSDFTTESLGLPTNWASFPILVNNTRNFNTGAFDDEGTLWIMTSYANPFIWAQIDLRPTSPTYMEVLQAGNAGTHARTVSDWSYNPLDGNFYMIADRTGGLANFVVWRFNTTTLAIENTGFAIPGGVLGGSTVGAQFSDADGFLYASNNETGRIMRVDMTTGEAVYFSDGPAALGNDGSSCVLASLNTDYGDAPASYGTLIVDNGPRHGMPDFDEINNTTSLMLGEGISAEDDGQPSAGADADTFDDGVLSPITITPDQPTGVDVVVTNNTNDVATLAGWIDLNANGTFDAGERVTVEVPANSGTTTQTLAFPGAPLLADDTYARFRIFPGQVADPSPMGAASSGEVEDYVALASSVRYQKTVNPIVTEIAPGQVFTYTVTVENTGSSDLTGLSFTDDLANVIDDATYNADAIADIGSVTFNAPDEIAWEGDLTTGQTATITYSVTINDPISGDGILTNSVLGDGPGSNCTEDPATDPDCTVTIPLPDVTSQKTLIGPTNPQPGDAVQYQFTITNEADVAATGITAADDLSGMLDDATYNNDALASSGAVSFNAATQRLNWNGSLAASGDPGDTVTVTYSVTVNDVADLGDGILRNALIAPGCPNPPIFDTGNPDYNADCVTETAIEAWMATKSVNPSGTVDPGTVLEYTIEVENVGGADLTGLSVDDDLTNILDDATFNNDESATVGSASYTAPTLNWTGDLTASQSATITYTVTVNDVDSLGDGVLSNVITGPMNCPSGDCETETLVSAWTIQKQSSPAGPLQAGDVVEYTIEVENVGGAAVDADFTDNLTEILDDASYNNDLLATVGTADYVEPIVSWEGALTPGQTSTITYSVTVDAASPDGDGVMTNAVVAPSAGCPDPAITNPTDPNFNANCVTVTLVEEWIATKSVTPDGTPVAPGEVVTYNIVIENTGATDLTGLSVNDDLSSVIDDASYNNDAAASVGDVDYTAPTLTWEGDLAQGENAIVSYSVTVNAAGELGDGVLNNVITGPMNCPSDDCETETLVEAWSASKTSSTTGTLNPGDTVTYTVEIVNEGTVDLSNLTVDDDLTNILDDASYNNDGSATIGTVNFNAPILQWSGDLNVGETSTLTYSVTINAADALGDGMLNNAITNAPNCPASECTTSDPVQAWVARKSVQPSSNVDPGDVVNFTVVVENTGATDLTGVDAPTIQDDMTEVLDDASHNNDESATIGTAVYTEPMIDWSNDLLVGESSTITYSVTVNDAENINDGVLNNVITGAPNCPSDVCTTSTPVSIFEVEKTSNPEDGSNVQPGDHITYNVSIHNTGSVALTNFSFDDNLSNVLNNAQLTGSAAVEPSSAGTTNISGTTLSFSGTINAGETVHVSYTVQVNQDAPANVELRNVVTGAFSNCVTGEEPECLTTHTVVPPQGTLPSLAERLAETGRHLLLPIILGASLLVSGILLYRRWAR